MAFTYFQLSPERLKDKEAEHVLARISQMAFGCLTKTDHLEIAHTIWWMYGAVKY
jgi:hypothetical protein